MLAAPSAVARLGAEERAALVRYRVPRTSDDGTCSTGALLAEPFDLLASLHGSPPAGGPREAAVLARQWVLARAVAALAAATGSDWLGVYRAVALPGSGLALCKEAYVGAPSRALFPLTAAFAEHSNNSTVGMTGDAVRIRDARALGDDTPYYVCDAHVRAELCVPIYAPGAAAREAAGGAKAEVIGIIDAEAFAPGHYEEEARAALILAAAAALGEAALAVGMLEEGGRGVL